MYRTLAKGFYWRRGHAFKLKGEIIREYQPVKRTIVAGGYIYNRNGYDDEYEMEGRSFLLQFP